MPITPKINSGAPKKLERGTKKTGNILMQWLKFYSASTLTSTLIIITYNYLKYENTSLPRPSSPPLPGSFSPLQAPDSPSELPGGRKRRRPHGLDLRRMWLKLQTTKIPHNRVGWSQDKIHPLSLWRIHSSCLQIHCKSEKCLARSPLPHPSRFYIT